MDTNAHNLFNKRVSVRSAGVKKLAFGLLAALLLALGAVFVAPVQAYAADTLPMYRLYNPYTGEHFYTANANELYSNVALGWNYEGIGWYAPKTSNTPVYRLFNRYSDDHHYTMDYGEYQQCIKNGWTGEGIGWYSDDAKTVKLYREYNPYAQRAYHNYTADKTEHDHLTSIGWRDEGTAWYGVKAPASSASTLARPSTAGALKVSGTRLVSSKTGEKVQLKGVSTHGLAWFPKYVNQTFFNELNSSWNANLVRLALYTAEYNGYCTGGNQTELLNLVDKGVNYAKNADMYAIIDWHVLNDQSPQVYKSQALQFFKTVSAKYKDYNNVIYEICNEPNGYASWSDIKAYANEVIPVIRANDPDAVIIVGTPTWSQDVDKAAADPLKYNNLMYALHFYAGTHKDDLRAKLRGAVQAGLPVFVSEFGACNADGNGSIDTESANTWINLLDGLNISYACWNLSNKNEGSALFKANCAKTSGFTTSDLSAEGAWYWGILHK